MLYADLLEKLRPLGVGQVGTLTSGGYTMALLARPNEAIFPFPFKNYPIILDDGDQTYVDEEQVLAIARRFGLDHRDLL